MKVKTIKQKVIVPGVPNQVYDAFIDAKKHSAFTGSKATCDPRVGGVFTAWDGYISGKNLVLEKGKRIVQEWVTTEWPKDHPPSRLELAFKKVAEGTELSIELIVHVRLSPRGQTILKRGKMHEKSRSKKKEARNGRFRGHKGTEEHQEIQIRTYPRRKARTHPRGYSSGTFGR
jgi:uncharacterized protein YndB with AHSA1/START domain